MTHMHEQRRIDLSGSIYRSFLTALLSAAIILAFSIEQNANASTVTSKDQLQTNTCLPSYYETLKSRAWLETQRKLQQAENYIFKPDSILDYSCFDRFMNIAALETEQIFSEYHAEYCFPDSLDCAIEQLVMTGVIEYLDANYSHSFLGGNSNANRDEYDPTQHKMCERMEKVWSFAKCMSFSPNMQYDNFYSFQQYVSKEVRHLPETCTNNPASKWTENITNTYNSTGDWRTTLLSTTTQVEGKYNEFVLSPKAASPPHPTSCGAFIKTGIDFNELGVSEQPDGICSNPGCTPTSAGTCVKAY